MSEQHFLLKNSLQPLPQIENKLTNKPKEDADLRAVAEQFEAIFVYQLLKAGRAAKLAEDPLNTQASEPFLDMMDQEYSAKMSAQNNLGIADAIVKQFNRK